MTPDATSILTVEDVRKLALPLNTRIIVGDGLLHRPVTWTTVVHLDDNLAVKTLQRDELVLLATPLHSRNGNATELEVVRWAADHHAAGLVLLDTPSPNAIAEAKAYSLPLLTLPPGQHPRMVEKTIVSLLVDRKGQLERRGIQIYRQLTQISSRNEGMAELINAMARLTNKTVVIQDKRLQPISYTLQPQFADLWDDLETFLYKKDNLPVEFQDRHRVSEADQPMLMQSLPLPRVARLVSPVVTKGIGRGYLSIIGMENDLDEIDMLVSEHGAAACAIEMAKQKMVSETEKRLRGTFLDRLLNGDVSQQEAARQGERFEHDMNSVHIALVISWRGDNPPSMRRLETTINDLVDQNRADALIWQREREREVVVFHATDDEDPIDTSLKLAEVFSREINKQFPGSRVAIGLGQPARDVTTWRNSHRDAVQARDLAIRLQTDKPLYIGDLGVYQLILSLNDREKLAAFCDKTLGPLVDYDMRQNADLLKTLEAFFNCHGNLSQTAEQLIVH
ncbi:MAG: PucR family transcriptional regulator ligand-binding domain-containing protein, partial [Anaerolineae bacterium]|nr:PucR family transcriptional regulator ligand-binding domain-containing protein [Anaerolineae bacterium]